VVALFILAALPVFAQEQAVRPNDKDGDFWHFRGVEKEAFVHTTDSLQGEYKVLYSDGQVKVFKLEATQELSDKTYQVEVLKRMLALRQDALQYLQFPIFVGKKWNASWRGELRGLPGRVYAYAADSQVTAIEEISTPAGSFRAFKIERQQRFGTTIARLTYYYSPLAKSIAKYSYYEESRQGKICCKRDIELIKFGSAR